MAKSKVATSTPDATKTAEDTAYAQAVTDLERLCGIRRRAMKGVQHGFIFPLTTAKARAFKLEKVQYDFLKRGCYVFNTDPADENRIAILPVSDKYAVIGAMQTNGTNWNRSTADIVRWLRRLEKRQPFILTGISGEHVAGRFTTKVRQPAKLAWQIMEFSPDVADVELEEQLRTTGRFVCWWT